MNDPALARAGNWSPKTIIVGYDGTSPAEQALKRAIELARTFDSRVIVADVAAPQPLQTTPGAFGYMPYYAPVPEHDFRVDEVLWQQHRASIDSLFTQAGVRHEFAGLVGEPATEIVEVAEQHKADLIVVGTREPGLLERLLQGSVSQGVARQAHCDVLIVHPPDLEGA
ncbi:MAG TPA: universal stress protein [Gaiellaceae bacterium]|nr:universal stress protein [Gaiellaceae bacterium]